MSVLLAPSVLAGCQSTAGIVLPEVARAACVGQEYLRKNGFLGAVPVERVTLLDSDLRYEKDGTLEYDRLVKDRHNSFSGKLRGVWTTEGSTKYLVVYGPIRKQEHCLGIKDDFSFAYLRKVCDGTGTFTALRERALSCRP